jgi:hypothetical protein
MSPDLPEIERLANEIDKDWNAAKSLCPIPTNIPEHTESIRRICAALRRSASNEPASGTITDLGRDDPM